MTVLTRSPFSSKTCNKFGIFYSVCQTALQHV